MITPQVQTIHETSYEDETAFLNAVNLALIDLTDPDITVPKPSAQFIVTSVGVKAMITFYTNIT
jgi:hypothetical protein